MTLKKIFYSIAIAVLSLSSSCSTELNEEKSDTNSPKLLSFGFELSANPLQLRNGVDCEIIGDSIVECYIPNIIDDKFLTPQLSYIGDNVCIDGNPYSGGGQI